MGGGWLVFDGFRRVEVDVGGGVRVHAVVGGASEPIGYLHTLLSRAVLDEI